MLCRVAASRPGPLPMRVLSIGRGMESLCFRLQVVAFGDLAVGGELVNDGGARRELRARGSLPLEPFELHDEGAEGVAMGGDDDVLAGLHVGPDFDL